MYGSIYIYTLLNWLLYVEIKWPRQMKLHLLFLIFDRLLIPLYSFEHRYISVWCMVHILELFVRVFHLFWTFTRAAATFTRPQLALSLPLKLAYVDKHWSMCEAMNYYPIPRHRTWTVTALSRNNKASVKIYQEIFERWKLHKPLTNFLAFSIFANNFFFSLILYHTNKSYYTNPTMICF